MVARYETINKFIKNIYYAKGLKFDEDFTTMWIREITATGASAVDLHDAEIEIIRENIPPRIHDVCESIREIMSKTRPKITYKPKTCPYCNGKGYVIGLRFETNGKYTGYTAALNCCCDNPHLPNVTPMTPNAATNHKTEVKNGYYLIFPTIVEQFNYLDRVYANDNWDIRRG